MSNPITNYPVVGAVTSADLLWDWQSGTQQACTMAQVKTFLTGGGTIAIANGKTLTASNTLTFTGTDGSTVIFGAGGTVLYAASIGSSVQAWSAKLDKLAALASPSTSAFILSSKTDGTLSWVPQAVTATASGSAIYVATPSPALAAYSTGQQVIITFTNANTGGSSLNLNGLGAAPIQQGGATIVAGQIPAGATLALIFDGTNFQIIGAVAGLASVVNSNPTALTISAAGSSTLNRGAATTLQYASFAAGSGAYAYALTLGTSGAVRGDRIELKIATAASTNPTVSIIGAATEVISGGAYALVTYLVYWFNGTSWDLVFRSA